MFQNAVGDLVTIRTYEKARQFFDKMPPVKAKGWGINERPLRSWRGSSLHHYRIEKSPNDASLFATYKLWLYDTPVITWKAPGLVELRGWMETVTTREFANKYLPSGYLTTHNAQQVIVINEVKYLCSHLLLLEQRDKDKWIVHSGVRDQELKKPTKTLVDKEKSGAVRKQLKPLEDYINTWWNMYGDNGDHPLINEPVPEWVFELTSYHNGWLREQKKVLELLKKGHPPQYVLMHFIPVRRRFAGNTTDICFSQIERKFLIETIRKAAYEAAEVYYLAPYDE